MWRILYPSALNKSTNSSTQEGTWWSFGKTLDAHLENWIWSLITAECSISGNRLKPSIYPEMGVLEHEDHPAPQWLRAYVISEVPSSNHHSHDHPITEGNRICPQIWILPHSLGDQTSDSSTQIMGGTRWLFSEVGATARRTNNKDTELILILKCYIKLNFKHIISLLSLILINY